MKKFYVLALLPVLVASGYCNEHYNGPCNAWIRDGEYEIATEHDKLCFEGSGNSDLIVQESATIGGIVKLKKGINLTIVSVPNETGGERKVLQKILAPAILKPDDKNKQVLVGSEDETENDENESVNTMKGLHALGKVYLHCQKLRIETNLILGMEDFKIEDPDFERNHSWTSNVL
jgi:hypothetical protein